jgi:ankyrin repeat protein
MIAEKEKPTDFFELVKTGTPQNVQAAIDKGEAPNAREKDGTTPLMYAAGYNQNPQVITTLLEARADINARDRYNNMTPLMYAAWFNQNPEVITVLLKAGADAKAKSSAGKTAFDFAQYNLKLMGTDAYRQLQEASK